MSTSYVLSNPTSFLQSPDRAEAGPSCPSDIFGAGSLIPGVDCSTSSDTTTTTNLLAPTNADLSLDVGDKTSLPISATLGEFAPSHHLPPAALSSANHLSPNSNMDPGGVSPSMNHTLDTAGNRSASPTTRDPRSSITSLNAGYLLQSASSKTSGLDLVRDILSPLVFQNAKSRRDWAHEEKDEKAGIPMENVKEVLSDDFCQSFAAKMQQAQSQLRLRLRPDENARRTSHPDKRKRSRSSSTPDTHNGEIQPSIGPEIPKAPRAMREGRIYEPGINGGSHYGGNHDLNSSHQRSSTRSDLNTPAPPSQATTSAVTLDQLDHDGDVTMNFANGSSPEQIHIKSDFSGAYAVSPPSICEDGAASAERRESRDSDHPESKIAVDVPIPPPLSVPGIWGGLEIGLPNPDILKFDFVINQEIAEKWDLNSSPENAQSEATKPQLALHLLCLPPWDSILVQVQEWQNSGVDLTSESFANLIWSLQTPWPPQGTLIIEVNKHSGFSKTILPNQLGSDKSSLNITKMVQPGCNTFHLIQLAPMPYCFAIYVSVAEPEPDMTCFAQLVAKQTSQVGHDIPIASTSVEVYPSFGIS
ncbi:hypothetical protein VKT23_018799 [Stygiomarasmius scandens]|uniref:Uncharacterized protein n=1 Tax=Marasmiellus scandens TaxID=2682957 RepID=A0ABR1IQZ5_9AGAR